MMLRVRRMTPADLPFGMRLKAQAGWNQREADWRRLLDLQPDGGFLAEAHGTPAGTVMTCRFESVAWISMMLVEEALRGRGIGRALMTAALEDLEGRGIRSVRLDATPLGRPLYESLGFVAEATFTRYRGIFPHGLGLPEVAEVAADEAIDAVLAFDREVTATPRDRLLCRLTREFPGSLRVITRGREVEGFLMSRPGAMARQIGPCIASMRAGAILLADARRRYPGETVVIDIPAGNAAATSFVEALGLMPERRLTRMGRGSRVEERLASVWASAGPETG